MFSLATALRAGRQVPGRGARDECDAEVLSGRPGLSQIDDDRRALLDHLASFTRTPDTAFKKLRRLRQHDERVRVPPAVHNALRRRDEVI